MGLAVLAVAVALVIAVDGGSEPAAERAPERIEADRPTPEDRHDGDRSEPGERSTQPEPRRSPDGEPPAGAEEAARPAEILGSPNPLRRARRAGYDVLRATPGGAGDVFDSLGGARAVRKLLGGRP